MNRDYTILICLILITIVLLLIFVSKKNVRKALYAVLVVQLILWSLGLMIFANFGIVEYPIRLFPKAANNSFLHGFIIYPSIYAIYYVQYPKHSKLIWRCLYTILIAGIPTLIEFLENKYTNLIHYITWNSYYSFALSLLLFILMKKYLDWFFENIAKQGVSRDEA